MKRRLLALPLILLFALLHAGDLYAAIAELQLNCEKSAQSACCQSAGSGMASASTCCKVRSSGRVHSAFSSDPESKVVRVFFTLGTGRVPLDPAASSGARDYTSQTLSSALYLRHSVLLI